MRPVGTRLPGEGTPPCECSRSCRDRVAVRRGRAAGRSPSVRSRGVLWTLSGGTLAILTADHPRVVNQSLVAAASTPVCKCSRRCKLLREMGNTPVTRVQSPCSRCAVVPSRGDRLSPRTPFTYPSTPPFKCSCRPPCSVLDPNGLCSGYSRLALGTLVETRICKLLSVVRRFDPPWAD